MATKQDTHAEAMHRYYDHLEHPRARGRMQRVTLRCGRCGRRVAVDDGYGFEEVGAARIDVEPGAKHRFYCHPTRCSTKGFPPVGFDRLEDVREAAHEDGRTELVLGVDL